MPEPINNRLTTVASATSSLSDKINTQEISSSDYKLGKHNCLITQMKASDDKRDPSEIREQVGENIEQTVHEMLNSTSEPTEKAWLLHQLVFSYFEDSPSLTAKVNSYVDADEKTQQSIENDLIHQTKQQILQKSCPLDPIIAAQTLANVTKTDLDINLIYSRPSSAGASKATLQFRVRYKPQQSTLGFAPVLPNPTTQRRLVTLDHHAPQTRDGAGHYDKKSQTHHYVDTAHANSEPLSGSFCAQFIQRTFDLRKGTDTQQQALSTSSHHAAKKHHNGDNNERNINWQQAYLTV
ncbi:MAG: hypothetical protein QG673_656 [Pseudomonadota bacterium]|nr:hypothetical protein [Pseudomonadota bacterium]